MINQKISGKPKSKPQSWSFRVTHWPSSFVDPPQFVLWSSVSSHSPPWKSGECLKVGYTSIGPLVHPSAIGEPPQPPAWGFSRIIGSPWIPMNPHGTVRTCRCEWNASEVLVAATGPRNRRWRNGKVWTWNWTYGTGPCHKPPITSHSWTMLDPLFLWLNWDWKLIALLLYQHYKHQVWIETQGFSMNTMSNELGLGKFAEGTTRCCGAWHLFLKA